MIPDFGEGSKCVTENRLFCVDWVRDNWGDVIQPALVQHVKLTLIAVAVGFVISLAAALLTHRFRLVEKPFVVVLGDRLHAPEPGAVPAPRTDHGPDCRRPSRSRSSATRC